MYLALFFLNIFKKNLTKWTTFQWFLIVVHKIHNLGIFPFSGEYQCSIMFCSLTAYFWCVNPHFSWTKPQFWFVFHDQTAKHHDIIMLNPYPSCVNHTKSIELSIFHAETLHSKNPQGDNFPRRPWASPGLHHSGLEFGELPELATKGDHRAHGVETLLVENCWGFSWGIHQQDLVNHNYSEIWWLKA